MLIAVLIALGVLVLLLFGAPYVPTHNKDLDLLFAKIKPRVTREPFIELGAGDGRVVRRAARAGFEATGYEHNPLLWCVAWFVCRKEPRARVVFGIWQKHTFSNGKQTVYVFGGEWVKKSQRLKNLSSGARLISYGFDVPPNYRNKSTIGTFEVAIKD